VWWEGLTDDVPAHLTDWQGRDWTPESPTPAAHANARFAVSAAQCPSIAPDWEDPQGVPVDAILFGGRRASNVPLVAEALSWEHGVFLGATISSERTAAAEGTLGELRHDPFAMLPFAGYNMAEYWRHWLEVGQRLPDTGRPKLFQVNWFRKDRDGHFLWPGFTENMRVLEWVCGRVDGTAPAEPSDVGVLPTPGAIDLEGLNLSAQDWAELFDIPRDAWLAECDELERWLDGFRPDVPPAVADELAALRVRLTGN